MDWELLVVLVTNALEACQQRPVPKAQHFAARLRADSLIEYGGRAVAAIGRGKNEDPNSYGTVLFHLTLLEGFFPLLVRS